MIRVLGAKRVLVIVFLVAMNIALAATVYLYIMPLEKTRQTELRGLNGKMNTVRGDINRMQIEFDALAAQQTRFDELKARGFFSNQQRRQAEKVFESIQKQAGVISALVKAEPGTVEDSPEAQKAEHKILSSPVSIQIQAVDSVDVFRYIYLLEHFFPGHITIKDISIERKSEVTGDVLRSIATGANPVLIEANIQLTWRTMIPQAQVIPNEQGKS